MSSNLPNPGSEQQPSSIRRKIDLSRLAFYRAWIQGIEVKEAANAYLGDMDLREAKSTIAWIRDELISAARRHKRLDYARLLRIRIPNRNPNPNPNRNQMRIDTLPSLDAFREERDPDGFYSENELLVLYREEYPENGVESHKEQRKKRLLERQLEAIRWAESRVSTCPAPTDSVLEWFDKPVASRLVLSGLPTLEQLTSYIRVKGYRWWSGIRQVGEVQGNRIVKFITEHETTLGSLGGHALAPLRQQTLAQLTRPAETSIMPMESFLPPDMLDGSRGSNRAPVTASRIAAQNDYQAIQAWIEARCRNDNTRRSYRREAERLLLWATLERGKALSSLSIEEVSRYLQWLHQLGRTDLDQWQWNLPQIAWIGQRNTPRWSPQWRPFEGKMALRSQQQSYTILKTLFEWLTKVRYLETNPWDAVAKPSQETPEGKAPDLEMSRAFSRAQWEFLMDFLGKQSLSCPDTATLRLQFVLPFAYMTGLRLSELVDARVGRLYAKPRKDGLGVRWMLKVLGKGQKWRAVPLPTSVITTLKQYLVSRGLSENFSEISPDCPIIGNLKSPEQPTQQSALYKSIKQFFVAAAHHLERAGHIEDARQMLNASTHWLRHTCGSHLAQKLPINMVQQLLGHASLSTTTIYTSTNEEALYEAIEAEFGLA